MQSLKEREKAEKQRADELWKQMEALKAKLPADFVPPAARPTTPPPGNRPRPLVAATPSPKKTRKVEETRRAGPSTRPPSIPKPEFAPQTSAPSTLLTKLSKTAVDDEKAERVPEIERSTSFADRPKTVQRDDNLALIEEFEPGPYEHEAPYDDPNWEQYEPHSGIRLSSRSLPHEDLQEYMYGRFYLAPSQLYSCVRLTDKNNYDVPVPGDWLTIAVVAERSPIRHTKAPIPLAPDEKQQWKGKGKEEDKKPTGKRFVILKLVDFGTAGKTSSSATGGQAVIRGDACLSLFLFEADNTDTITTEGSSKVKKAYRGGSGGAFESLSKCKEGDVVVILNPRIMKPNQGTSKQNANILGLTPESAESITVLGRAADMGLCAATKRDGSRCNAWYDRRVCQACEFHVQETVKRARAARPEFTAGTSGMTQSVKRARYDPQRKWGMHPESESPAATFVLAGHVVRTSETSERIGREAQAKAQRQMAKDADQSLKSLLERDKDGMKAVMTAREHAASVKAKAQKEGKGKGKETEKRKFGSTNEDEGSKEEGPTPKRVKTAFNASMVKEMGFNPAAKSGQKSGEMDQNTKSKLDRLSLLQATRNPVNLKKQRKPHPVH
ncbi:hypothetical protein CYLTODRAFT_487787 [Cylindrobasidium torrendii FP15055 ss-10]|uniref:Zinc finger Mcm10/DnaG-type domain-containing protein n=1 Tax=Cylindrobasidium torrendii FP15055 ss-10 TaxID=1314674 RepID=A0A0D7BKN3_9AGAR|nr:hypothetical protein CYLTODRAFT_487787 [Cylindrobasidium torrendii FP15055 ss-10]